MRHPWLCSSLLSLLALVAFATHAQEQRPTVRPSLPPMWTIQDYRDVFLAVSGDRTPAEVRTLKIAYVRGVIEGAYWSESRRVAPESQKVVHDHFLNRCLAQIGGWINVLALFDKWVEEHPDATNEPVAYRLLQRTENWCRNNGVR